MSPKVMRQIAQSACIVSILHTIVGMALAQVVIGAKAGIIDCIEGEVFLDEEPESLSKSRYVQIKIGQRLRTQKGRAEVLPGPDVYLRLGENALLRINRNQLDDTRMELEQGPALVEIAQENKGIITKVQVSDSIVEITKAGLYRLDAGSGELQVYGGTARITCGKKEVTIKSGKKARLNGNFAAAEFDAKAFDSLHQWAARRSFDLFNATACTRTQNHWRPVSLGWAFNGNYRMRFRSDPLLAEWQKSRWPTLAEATAAAEKERMYLEEQEYRARQALKAKIEAEAARTGGIR
jgi:hypothetical protein